MSVPNLGRHGWAMVAAALAQDLDGLDLLIDDLDETERRLVLATMVGMSAELLSRGFGTDRGEMLTKVREGLAGQFGQSGDV